LNLYEEPPGELKWDGERTKNEENEHTDTQASIMMKRENSFMGEGGSLFKTRFEIQKQITKNKKFQNNIKKQTNT
jgi:GTP cyclohydrolase III